MATQKRRARARRRRRIVRRRRPRTVSARARRGFRGAKSAVARSLRRVRRRL